MDLIGRAVGLFAVTNVDDLVVLALFFAQGRGRPGTARVVAVGQYLGFLLILGIAAAAAFGATLLPEDFLPYLGLLPLALGVHAAVQAWRHRRDRDEAESPSGNGPRIWQVAAVTFANGGDNIGAYVPVFATAGVGGMSGYAVVFLVLVAVWIAAGRYLAGRPAVARVLARWGNVLLPVVLIALGLLILIEGGR
ncbi:cadmium resistance transporter [Amycolatopsis rhabdoformis]|uniref:Cadmium resistance transporter n=1 Tax=Amycolatopsis rhabdoformis TaxID=1448059 RepID=A0ABZ1I6Y2_9PSEU|nr:cadmium resistance transporter [Amycolatopsis rhabdoformis]WSE29628.1 cadmium resistance transporter [Amycolatopsis rhabdoformis]